MISPAISPDFQGREWRKAWTPQQSSTISLKRNGHNIGEAEAAARYLDLPPPAQVAADVAAEGITSQHRNDVSRCRSDVH
jgi:hypothetical protein